MYKMLLFFLVVGAVLLLVLTNNNYKLNTLDKKTGNEFIKNCEKAEIKNIYSKRLKTTVEPADFKINFENNLKYMSWDTRSKVESYVNSNKDVYVKRWEKLMSSLYGKNFFLQYIIPNKISFSDVSRKLDSKSQTSLNFVLVMYVSYKINFPGFYHVAPNFDDIFVLYMGEIKKDEPNIANLISSYNSCTTTVMHSYASIEALKKMGSLKNYNYYVSKINNSCFKNENKTPTCMPIVFNPLRGHLTMLCYGMNRQNIEMKGDIDLITETVCQCKKAEHLGI